MTLKAIFGHSAKLTGLVALYGLMFVIGLVLFPIPWRTGLPPEQMQARLIGLLLLALVDTLVVALIILRSRWSGWRLMAATGFALYGVMTFMAQIETAWFAPAMRIPSAWLPPLFLSSLPIVLGFVPLAVLILGKWQVSSVDSDDPLPLPSTFGAWAWRLALIALAYLVLYFGAGFMVAWQNPAVRALYGNGGDAQVFNAALLVPFQVLRSALWVLFALPVIRMTRGNVWQVALVVALLYALPMNMPHAIPNALMSDSVRLSHFIETTSSNFIFGLAVVGTLCWKPGRTIRRLAVAAHQ